MNEYTKKKVKIVAGLLALAVCIALVVNLGASGGLSTGLTGLAVELLGLGGVLALLGVYNHGYQ